MRYILNNDGYVRICSDTFITCENKTCTAYTGTVPDGYDNLADWLSKETERLNAWKIENGNLVFDEDKYNQLKAIYEAETKANTPVEGGIVKITLPTDLANLSTSYNYFHPFNYSDNDVLTEGNKLTYGSMSVDYGDRTGATVYGVTVGEDVSYVRVTSNVRILNNSTSKLAFTTDVGRIRDGELTTFGGTSDTLQSETRHTSSVVVTQIPVQQGDFLFIYAYKGSKTADVDVVSAWGMTNATFEVTHVKGVTVINSTGGSGGTDDYESLNNLPRINGTKVTGNKTLEEYGIQPAGNYALKTDVPDVTEFATSEEVEIISSNINDRVDIINNAVNQNISDISTINGTLENKVDKVSGKGLSTNDFTNTYKSNVDNNTSARHTHSNKTVLDGITSANITSWNNKSDFSGSYDDLTNKPTIPTVPTKISAFTNDSGYLTSIPSEYITETELNAKGYLTKHQDISGKQDKLVSGTNIKTINGTSLLGSGDLTIEAGSSITELTSNFNVWELETGLYWIKPNVTMTNYTTYYSDIGTAVGITESESMATFTNQLTDAFLIVRNYFEGFGLVEFEMFITNELPAKITGATMYQDGLAMGATVSGGDFVLFQKLMNKQDKLVSGTNIKTINNQSLLGSGNITIEGGSGGGGIETLTGSTRLSNLAQGVYLIAPSTVIYYYGATGTSSFTLSSGGVLSISDGNDSYKGFEIVAAEGAEAYIYLGATSSSYGFYAKLSRVDLQNAKACTYASSQRSIGYYNSTGTVSNLNSTMYIQPNEWSITISNTTTGAPSNITGSTKVYISVKAPGFAGSGLSSSLMPYIRQDMYAPSLNKHWYRIVNYSDNSNVDYGEWVEIKETVDCSVYNVTGDATDVTTAVATTIATLKIPSGTYIVNAHVNFATNSTGVRKIYIGTQADYYSNTRALADNRRASSHQATMSNISTILNVEEETTYYLNVYQNSGSALSCSGSLRAIRLGDSAEYQAGL